MTEDTQSDKKKPITDEERLELCEKLDQELEDFIRGLEKKRYTEGWPEDRWEEEMDKHPFFMKSNPDSKEMSPLVEGLAKLKYDPEENTPLELATNYKEDGNFNFKHKNYRLAILSYTEGIKLRCDDAEVNAGLYNNRAAAHWYLRNYRSALFDCERALTFKANYPKARLRAAKSAFEIDKFDICIEHCKKLLETQPMDMEICGLLHSAKMQKVMKLRDERKRERKESKKNEEKEKIVKAVIERGIHVWKCQDPADIDVSKLEPTMPGADDCMVHIDDDGILKWPVLFMYPEYQMTDFVKDSPENVPLQHQLEQVFPAPWDKHKRYKMNKVNVYFEGYDKRPHLVDLTKNLGDILSMKYYELREGTPTFFVLPRGSVIERSFLKTPR